MAKIKTSKKHRHGTTILTKVGNVTFNEKGEAEVKDEHALFLAKHDPSIEIVGAVPKGKKAPTAKEIEEENEANAGDDTGAGSDLAPDPDEDPHEDKKAELMELDIPALHEICATAKLPKNRYSKMGKEKLVNYIVANVKFEGEAQ